MFSYCLITDRNYINSTICLTNKIVRKNINILCLDDYTENFLNLNFKNISTYNIKNLETKYNLHNIRSNRDWRSYVFTLKSIFLSYLMDKIKKNQYLIYLDSDLYLFSEIEKFEENITESSVHITPHNFDKNNIHRNIYGNFNAGLLVFKKDYDGLKVLEWWKKKCSESCSLMVSENIYADQKYLNNFHLISDNIKVLNNPGINAAPWNLNNHECKIRNKKIYLDNHELLIYHFHSFKNIFGYYYKMGLKEYNVSFDNFSNFIYSSYSKDLKFNYNKFNNENFKNKINFYEILKSFLKRDIKKLN